MFLLVSAFVGFHGWPQVAAPSSKVSVSIPAAQARADAQAARSVQSGGAVAGHTQRRLAALTGANAHHRAGHAGAGAGGSPLRLRHAHGGTILTGTGRSGAPGH